VTNTSQISSTTTPQGTNLPQETKNEYERELQSLHRSLIRDDPFLMIEEGHLIIKTKAGEMKPLVLNKAQRRLHSKIKSLWYANKIIRIILLKARQLGASTWCEALLYSVCSLISNQNSVVIASDKDGSNYLFEMSKLYHEKCPGYLKPKAKKSNEKKLEFEGLHSQILNDTADNKEAGRGYTFRLVHLSEYAFFRQVNADEIMLGLSHSVPSMPRTIIIKESTANGFNHFKDDWDAAESGETDEVAIFIPWYWGEEYQMPVDDTFKIGDSAFGYVSQDETCLADQMYKEGIDLIEERLQWRRWDIKNNCKGDLDKFRQENPSTPEEAFIASGACYFDQRQIVKQLKQNTEPLFKADIVKENYQFVLRKSPEGTFAFYKNPSKYAQYCVGGDAASGSGTDWSTLIALDKHSNETVAEYRAKSDPDELAYQAYLLGSFLNQGKVAIENDKFGYSANQKLRTLYGNIYVQRSYNKLENKVIEKFGWDTTAVTRPLMLGQLQSEIREGSTRLGSKLLMKECLTFIKNAETKKAEAEQGKNDDLVIARAIAGQLRHDEPYQIKPERPTGREVNKEDRNAGLRFGRKT